VDQLEAGMSKGRLGKGRAWPWVVGEEKGLGLGSEVKLQLDDEGGI
jgi:hypothetical protein